MSISRRTMLRHLAMLSAAHLTLPATPLLGTPLGTDAKRILDSAVDRLLPGAKDAGVVRFMRYWFKEPAFKPLERYFKEGTTQLEKTAITYHKRSFIALSGAAQDDVLTRFLKGQVQDRRFDGRLFFQQLMELTVEGYLSDPKYGGNIDRVGWKTIGIPDGLRSCWWNPNGVAPILNPDDGFND